MVTRYSDNGEWPPCPSLSQDALASRAFGMLFIFYFYVFFCTNEYLELLLLPTDGVAGVAGEGGDDRGVNGGSRCFTTRLEPQVEYFI